MLTLDCLGLNPHPKDIHLLSESLGKGHLMVIIKNIYSISKMFYSTLWVKERNASLQANFQHKATKATQIITENLKMRQK